VFGGGAGGGKSWLGAEWLMTNCYRYPGSKWFIGREELKRLMGSSFITFQKVCKHHNIPAADWKLNGQYNFIEFANGSRIDLLDLKNNPSDPMFERLGSLEYTGGWIDEAGEVEFRAFDVLKSRVGRHMNKELGLLPKMLLTCNPNKGWLHREVYKPYKAKTLDPKYSFIQSLYHDNPYTSKSYGESLKDITDNVTRQRLMYGNWDYADDDTCLLKHDTILDLFTNVVVDSTDKYIVADIARYGGDRIVIGVFKGLKLYKVIHYTHKSLQQTEQILLNLMAEERIPRSHVLVDEDGIGGGVIDHIPGIKGFVNNSTPLEVRGEKQNYQNLKTQCIYEFARLANMHNICIEVDDEEIKEYIIEELAQLKRKDSDKDGKLKVEPKDVVKQFIGRSPDFSDMLIMRMYFELQPSVRPNQFSNSTSIKKARFV